MATPKILRDIYHNAAIAGVEGRISTTAGFRWVLIGAKPMHVAQVLIEAPFEGRLVLWRGLCANGKWGRLAPVVGTIEGQLG